MIKAIFIRTKRNYLYLKRDYVILIGMISAVKNMYIKTIIQA